MELRFILSLSLCVWGASGKPDHAELRGEHPKQEDIDNGECVPIPCVDLVPPPECKRLCDLRHYETVCQPPANFCLCRHTIHGKKVLVSPDEVLDQPPDSSEVADKPLKTSKVTPQQEPSKVISEPLVPMKAEQSEQSSKIIASFKVVDRPESPEVFDQPQEQPETEDSEIVSFQIFTIFLPIKRLFYETPDDESPTLEPTADTLALGYETVNVHEGRLFWDFRYILTGLLLLMIGLVAYELAMCAMQVYGSKRDISVKSEQPEVKVKPIKPFLENEKILNV